MRAGKRRHRNISCNMKLYTEFPHLPDRSGQWILGTGPESINALSGIKSVYNGFKVFPLEIENATIEYELSYFSVYNY